MKKSIKKWVLVCLCILVFLTGMLCILKINGIARFLNGIKSDISDWTESRMRNEIRTDITGLEKLKEEDGSWYTEYSVIAHALGGIEGKIYTNSLEAITNSYENGTRLFDADLRFTSDGSLVVRHDCFDDLETDYTNMISSYSIDDVGQAQVSREELPTYAMFQSELIFKKYTPLSFHDLVDFMEQHPDVYIIPDIKETDIEDAWETIVSVGEGVLDRIIVSIYRYEDYDKIMNLYPFKNIMFRQHEVHPNNNTEMIAFCIEKNIHAININTQYFEADDMEAFKDLNIKLYVAVVNSIKDFQRLYDEGVNGVVSDWISEDDMKYVRSD